MLKDWDQPIGHLKDYLSIVPMGYHVMAHSEGRRDALSRLFTYLRLLVFFEAPSDVCFTEYECNGTSEPQMSIDNSNI